MAEQLAYSDDIKALMKRLDIESDIGRLREFDLSYRGIDTKYKDVKMQIESLEDEKTTLLGDARKINGNVRELGISQILHADAMINAYYKYKRRTYITAALTVAPAALLFAYRFSTGQTDGPWDFISQVYGAQSGIDIVNIAIEITSFSGAVVSLINGVGLYYLNKAFGKLTKEMRTAIKEKSELIRNKLAEEKKSRDYLLKI